MNPELQPDFFNDRERSAVLSPLDKTGLLDKVKKDPPQNVDKHNFGFEGYCGCSNCNRKRTEEKQEIKQFRASVDETEKLQKRVASKTVSHRLASVLHLLDSPLKKAYERTMMCAHFTKVEDGKLQTQYCKCRWCLTCNRNRTAQLIDDYVPVVVAWDDAYMVTLTRPNVAGFDLEFTVNTMYDVFSNINRLLKRGRKRETKKNRAFDPQEFEMIRKAECTSNVDRNDYHPHFHVLINNLETAQLLVEEWLKAFPDASSKAQDIRPVGREKLGAVKELFKYYTKMFTSVKDKNGDANYVAHADRLDMIFRAMHGKRTIQTYGFNKSDYEQEREEMIEDIEEATEETDQLDDMLDFDENTDDSTDPAEDGYYKWKGDNWYKCGFGSDDIDENKPIVPFTQSEKLKALLEGIYLYGHKASENDFHPDDFGTRETVQLIFPWNNYVYTSQIEGFKYMVRDFKSGKLTRCGFISIPIPVND